jgi:hypothetical protein
MAGLPSLPQILACQPPHHGILDARPADDGAKGAVSALRPTDPEHARLGGASPTHGRHPHLT